jgi:hypothetical protein
MNIIQVPIRVYNPNKVTYNKNVGNERRESVTMKAPKTVQAIINQAKVRAEEEGKMYVVFHTGNEPNVQWEYVTADSLTRNLLSRYLTANVYLITPYGEAIKTVINL